MTNPADSSPGETDRPASERPDPASGAVLLTGELQVLGRIRSASNATFLCVAEQDDHSVHCVYKPISGERPLWDFPDGTLAGRECATYLVSTALGWNIVPHTIIRDGPAGPGMVQRWIDQPEREGHDLVDLCGIDQLPADYLPVLRAYDHSGDEVLLIHADDPRLLKMAVFDVLVNNADRKGGHILHGVDDEVYGVDHGLCLHTEDKLRTVLWGWAGKPIDGELLTAIAGLADQLNGALADELGQHLTTVEVQALRERTDLLLTQPELPGPQRRGGHGPIPWPAF